MRYTPINVASAERTQYLQFGAAYATTHLRKQWSGISVNAWGATAVVVVVSRLIRAEANRPNHAGRRKATHQLYGYARVII